MKKFWISIVVLLLLMLGYQLMKSTQLSVPGSLDITGSIQHYVSDNLGVEFDYMDYVDNVKINVSDSGNILSIGSDQLGFQKMELLNYGFGDDLESFVGRLLTGMNKKCSFSIKAVNYLTDKHAQQLTVFNTSSGNESALCKSVYDNWEGLRFFAYDLRTPASVYFFVVGVESDVPGTLDLRTPWYQTLKFLATGEIVSDIGSGPLTDDSTGHINLIKTYYNAIQTHDFVTAASLVASGEKDSTSLQASYANVVELSPFKIEEVGDNLYHFYVRFLDKGATQPSLYSLKKTVVDGKLKSVLGGKLVTNASTDHFRYYSDQFLEVNTKPFNVLDLLNAQDLMKSDCARPATKDLAYFKKLLSVFSAQDGGTKYSFNFKGLVAQSANVYVVPNKIKYPAKEAFFEDFEKCQASTKYTPFLITIDSMIFVDGCAKGEKGYCNDIKNMLRQTIKVK